MSARSWTVEIPAPGRWLNLNDRAARRADTPTRRAWYDATLVHARAAKLPWLHCVHITAHLHFTDRRRRDPHNYMSTIKVIVDALVDYGLISDDSSAYLIGPDVRLGDPLPRKTYGPAGRVTLTIREAAP